MKLLEALKTNLKLNFKYFHMQVISQRNPLKALSDQE